MKESIACVKNNYAIRKQSRIHTPFKRIIISIFTFVFSTSCMALQSIKLKDVINSKGTGDINLFTAFSKGYHIDGNLLEQYRQNNNSELVFAVDVNEAANGSEKASTQGVAIESAELILSINDVEFRYTDYTTRTKTMLAKIGSTQRSLYSTLLGDTGSNRITNNVDSDINNSSFDATLNFPIIHDISQASSARLNIQFLDTNVSLGDPEEFYDFSNGFEDIAIITDEDATYLNQLSVGKEEAPLVLAEDSTATSNGATVYYPSQTSYYIASYEDYFPYRGDYDFNDLVVGYRISTNIDLNGDITAIEGEGYLIARGAGYNHDWHLRIAMPEMVSGQAEINLFAPDTTIPLSGYPITSNILGDIVLNIFPRTRQLWSVQSYEGVNTLLNQTLIKGHRFTLSVSLDSPISISQFDTAPFDPFIYVHDTNYEIHLPGKSAVLAYSWNIQNNKNIFSDEFNYPFAQVFPEDWQTPIERVDLGDAYPEFITFITSNKKQNVNWYRSPNSQKVKALTPSLWKW